MFKKIIIVYLLIGFIGYTLFENKDDKINNIVSISSEVDTEAKHVLTSETIKANMLIHAFSYSKFIGINYQEVKQIGSGVIIDEFEGYYYILSNAHVVNFRYALSKFKYVVYDYQGNSYKAEVVRLSMADDLALIKFKKAQDLHVINIADDSLNDNEIIYAIGNPNNVINCIRVGKFNKYANIINTKYQVINHSAEITSGSSGGMLVDKNYELVGINTWASFDKTGNYISSYAIPHEVIIKFLEKRQ